MAGSEKKLKEEAEQIRALGGIQTNHMDEEKEMIEDTRIRKPLNEGSQ